MQQERTEQTGTEYFGSWGAIAPYLLCVVCAGIADRLHAVASLMFSLACQLVFGCVPVNVTHASVVKRVTKRLKKCEERNRVWCSNFVFGKTLGKHPAGALWANVHGQQVFAYIHSLGFSSGGGGGDAMMMTGGGGGGDKCEVDNIWLACSITSLETLTSSTVCDLDDDPPSSSENDNHVSTNPDEKTPLRCKQLTCMSKNGPCAWLEWTVKSESVLLSVEERTVLHPKQRELVDDMIALTEDIRAKVVSGGKAFYVYGPSGTGKTELGEMFAIMTNSVYCNRLDPTEPGNFIDNVIDGIDADENHRGKNVVFVWNESDNDIEKVLANGGSDFTSTNGQMPVRVAVKDKGTLNNFLDEFKRPRVVLIMTGNRGPGFIDRLDPSVFRYARCWACLLDKRPLPLSTITNQKPKSKIVSSYCHAELSPSECMDDESSSYTSTCSEGK